MGLTGDIAGTIVEYYVIKGYVSIGLAGVIATLAGCEGHLVGTFTEGYLAVEPFVWKVYKKIMLDWVIN